MRLIGVAVVLAVSIVLSPPVTEAQQPAGKVWRIGVLLSLYPSDADAPQALREALRTLGYVEGQNLAIEWRYAEGHDNRLPGLAADLVRLTLISSSPISHLPFGPLCGRRADQIIQ